MPGIQGLTGRLDEEVAYLRSHQYADSTKLTYTSQLRSYLNFCTLIAAPALPASAVHICRYIAFLSRTKSFTSVQQYLNIISILHKLHGLKDPTHDYSIVSLLKAVQRVKGTTPAYRLPLSIIQIRDILRHLNLSNFADLQFCCIMLACFFGLLRISSVTCAKASNWIPNKTLLRKHLSFDVKGCTLTFHWSKTIQYRQRSLLVPLPFLNDHTVCPARAIMRFAMLTRNLSPDTPAFAYMEGGKLFLPTAPAVRRRMSELLHMIGVDNASDYSAHSLRRGGACYLLAKGVPVSSIKILGDWKSDCVFKYLTPDIETKFDILKLI